MAFKGYASPGQFNPRKVQDQTQKIKERDQQTKQGKETYS